MNDVNDTGNRMFAVFRDRYRTIRRLKNAEMNLLLDDALAIGIPVCIRCRDEYELMLASHNFGGRSELLSITSARDVILGHTLIVEARDLINTEIY